MSTSPINGVSSAPLGAATGAGLSRIAATPSVTGSQYAGDSGDAVSVDTFPGAPPPEVLAAISNATAVGERLAAASQRVSFSSDPNEGLQINLVDDRCGTSTRLSASGLLSLADGS